MNIFGLVALLTLTPLAWAQATINMSHDLIGLGISSVNLTPNQPSLDAGPLLVQTVAYAQQNGIGTIIADTGAYYFLTEQQTGIVVILNQVNGLTIDFQNSDLYIASQNYGIVFNNSSNVTLENFTVDRMQLDYTQLLITSVDPVGGQINFSVQPGWQSPSALNAILSAAPGGPNLSAGWAFPFRDGKQIRSRVSVNLPYVNDHITLPANPQVAEFLSAVRPGDILVLAARVGGHAIYAPCSNCTFHNIKVYSGYEGFALAGPASGTVLDHVYVMPKPGTDRLVSTMADGITMNQPGPNNTLQFCRAIRTLDDGFSPHIWAFAQVQSAVTTRTLQVAGIQTTAMSQGFAMPNGSNVVFQSMTDGTISGNAVLVSQGNVITTNGIKNATLTFDRDLPTNLTGTFVYSTDASWRAGGLAITRSTVQFAALSSMTLWGLMNTSVAGNYILQSAWAGIVGINNIQAAAWETPPDVNLSITHNVIDGAPVIVDGVNAEAYAAIETVTFDQSNGLMAVSTHQNVTIADNFIKDASRSAAFLGNVAGASVTGNYLLDPNSNPAPVDAPPQLGNDVTQPISMEVSTGVTVASNTIDSTSRHILVTDTGYRELAAYLPAALVRLNAYNLGTLANPSVTLTDANGVTTSASVKESGTHFLDVQLPASALGGAYFTLTAGGATYFGTLFIDNADSIPALNGCTYRISPSSNSAGSGGGALPVLVVTQPGCAYSVLDTDAFVTPGTGGTGTGVVSVGFSANAGAARSTTVEIAAWTFSVAQSAVQPTIQAIVDSWDYTAGIAPGTWVTIAGTALASGAPQTWSLTGTQLPTSLGGVMVTFNGAAAALLYVSPTQINALVPASVAPGPVQVVVQLGGVSSSPFTITATATQPAIYAPPSADGKTFFVTAALQGTGFLVGNSTTDPRVIRGARPGDILDLYMIGLGATADPSKFITSQSFAGAYPVSASVTATVGGEAAQVLFAGLTSPGLYLVRIGLPADLSAGPQPIQISAGSTQTTSSLVLMMSAPAANLIQNGSFESALTGTWTPSIDSTTGVVATIQRTTSTAVDGSDSAQIDVSTPATASSSANPCVYCAVQFLQTGLPIQQGTVYQLQFWAKADTSRTMNYNIIQAGAPFHNEGLETIVTLGGTWQRYVIYFQATATDPNGRVTFFFGDQAGNTWLDSVALQ